ncbi:ribonuclease catalytic domain-containing protein [Desulfovibrio sp. OttesenSCG-928-F07]|nr:ribonuclease catalytic domain-containing protein [Desulfovibrio sp. OttesenSCG-928-F07]
MSLPIVKFPAQGCIVEFMQGNRPVLAWVLESQASQLRLYTLNKRETKLAPSRLLPWSGPSYGATASRAEIDERLEMHHRKREGLAAQIDLQDLWELAQGELNQADIMWFASLLWAEPDIDMVAALGSAMLARKTHFKFSPPYFEIYTAQQVEERQRKEEHEQRLNDIVQNGADFFRKLYESSRGQHTLSSADFPDPAVQAELKTLLLTRLADPEAHDPDNIWKMLTKNISAKNVSDDPYLPLVLATNWGIVPEHHNFWLNRNGYDGENNWYTDFAPELEAVKENVNRYLTETLQTLNDCKFISVDPAHTRDWDDACYARKLEDGYEISIAIACPGVFWPFGGAMDKTVLRRASSLYLPEAEHCMLPDPLCYDVFSLKAGSTKPVMHVALRLDEDCNLLASSVTLTATTISANIPLFDSELMLGGNPHSTKNAEQFDFAPAEFEDADSNGALPQAANSPYSEYAELLNLLYSLALKLREKRIQAGAVITERNDPEITLLQQNGTTQVELTPGLNFERSHLMVGEIMILCNSALAKWASEQNIPIVYRTQVASIPKECAGVWTRPHDINRVLKNLPPAKLSVDPKPHAGVGANFYSSLTAPMRRYIDLLNQAQVASFITAATPRLERDTLETTLTVVNSRTDSAGQIQRFRTRYWKLLYLQQQEQKNKGKLNYWEAVITEDTNLVTVVLTLTGLILRGPRALFGDRVSLGSTVGIRVGKINPVRNEIQIMEVVDY